MKTYQHIARKFLAACGTTEWAEIAHHELKAFIKDTAPSGSGIDNGTKLDATSKPNRLVFTFGFHHMDENGYYDGWTTHTAVVTPSLVWGYDLRITGQNRNEIKDYLHDVFTYWLNEEASNA